MNHPPLAPNEAAQLDQKRASRRAKQPYAAELDDRELEHAAKDRRPLNPKPDATSPRRPSKTE